MPLLTTKLAAAFLEARGITVRQRGKVRPPDARTVQHWCETKALDCQRVGGPRRGYWMIDERALLDFTPPRMGRGDRKQGAQD